MTTASNFSTTVDLTALAPLVRRAADAGARLTLETDGSIVRGTIARDVADQVLTATSLAAGTVIDPIDGLVEYLLGAVGL